MADDNKTFLKSRAYHTAKAAPCRACGPGHPKNQSRVFLMGPRQSTIAIVEDDPAVRQALEQLLSVLGYRTELFASAEEFLIAAPASEAACLILDIQLDDITGIELARQLALDGLKFPTIFMTGSRNDTIQQQALDFGCIAYLHKPFHADQLIDAIRVATGANPG